MFNNVTIEEESPNRFQAQIYEISKASIIALLLVATLFGGVLNLSNGDTAGAIMCFLIAGVMAVVFGVFVGIRRITIDRDANLVYLTFRAILRKRQEEFPLSDVTTFDFTRASEGQILEVGPEDPFMSRWGYSLGMTTEDGSSHDLYTHRGAHVFDLGHRIRDWLDAHHALTAPHPSQ